MDRRLREKRKAAGLCVLCGKIADGEHKSKCKACSAANRLRERAYRKFAGPCIICGFPYADVHHKDGNHNNNDVANLVSLCPNHHRLVHMNLLNLV